MTPEELISRVCDDLERPDLTDMARARLLQSLYETHAIDFFERDKVSEDTAVVVNQAYLDIAKPARFRKLASVQALDAAGSVVFEKFVNRGVNKDAKNYFGITEPNTYRVNSTNIRIDFSSTIANSLGTAITHIRLWYWQFPTWAVANSVATSDSWILTEYPFPVVDDLCARLSSTVDDDTSYQKFKAARDEGRRFLLTNYPADIPTE